MPEDELGTGPDRIEDPNGEGPRIWFQIVPEKKSINNRIHIDVNASGGRDVSLDTRRCPLRAAATPPPSCGQGHDDPRRCAHVGHAPDVLVLADAADQPVAVRGQAVDGGLQVVDLEGHVAQPQLVGHRGR